MKQTRKNYSGKRISDFNSDLKDGSRLLYKATKIQINSQKRGRRSSKFFFAISKFTLYVKPHVLII